MPRVCVFTGRKTSVGHTYTHRGKAKYLGGVGIKVTGKTKRTFKPNIQTLTAVVDGSLRRIKVSTKAMKNGLVVKRLQRKFTYHSKLKAEAQAQTEAAGAPAAEAGTSPTA
jgi:large subunit ribosomal protein L28